MHGFPQALCRGLLEEAAIGVLTPEKNFNYGENKINKKSQQLILVLVGSFCVGFSCG